RELRAELQLRLEEAHKDPQHRVAVLRVAQLADPADSRVPFTHPEHEVECRFGPGPRKGELPLWFAVSLAPPWGPRIPQGVTQLTYSWTIGLAGRPGVQGCTRVRARGRRAGRRSDGDQAAR